ncbi:hypothetical protein V6N13_105612 [Hibiscus sabdariffa]|uniref:Uncharacterized protein n=1 Tax=Hibiscus sabdariffa TaxID=183260 RepID=A0ABR2EY94_9ROSI
MAINEFPHNSFFLVHLAKNQLFFSHGESNADVLSWFLKRNTEVVFERCVVAMAKCQVGQAKHCRSKQQAMVVPVKYLMK